MTKIKQHKMHPAGLAVTIAVIAVGIYDLISVIIGRPSVSNFLIPVGFDAPMIVFMAGFAMGHVFGYIRVEKVVEEKK